ncbi:MAG: phospho-sugar mutase [Chitinivibrionales bacterium]|nr:phospho-sugar mutase [Chitinivibrionales bacterium]MBD3356693.1 phospho-sugar mutase [Chitinivibrionales bacterium]
MDKEALLAAAEEYLKQETHDTFRHGVEELIRRESFDELYERFYTNLTFGTGGLRGIIGGGFNRMNPFVVRRATQGVANYIRKNAGGEPPSIVIAYDSRRYSDLFAEEAALVLAANGIKTYLFMGLRPTPELSYAVRYLEATAGIVVTASHNPPEYNGYKVYWEDGGQIVAPHDKGIVQEALSVTDIRSITREEALDRGVLFMIDREIDDAFTEMVKSRAVRPDLIREKGGDIKVVFTPLHGAGAVPVSRALSEMGIKVIFVEEQRAPDGDFPTVKKPNPEEAEALSLALDLARRVEADLVLATDPDADRLGIAVPDNGSYRLVTGNQLGVLLADYIFSSRAERGTLPEKPAFVKTIVTTELQRRIAESYGARCFDTLTGFKYIAAKIREFESNGEGLEYVFGGEESYGYLVETETRDKNAVSAATMTAETALYHLSQGRTVLEQLNRIWEKYGYFEETLISQSFEGSAGMETMKALMEELRRNPPRSFGTEQVMEMRDYRERTVLNPETGQTEPGADLPTSDVLQFVLAKGDLVTVRPSGTEPKIKLYASCGGEPGGDLETAKATVGARMSDIRQALEQIIKG